MDASLVVFLCFASLAIYTKVCKFLLARQSRGVLYIFWLFVPGKKRLIPVGIRILSLLFSVFCVLC